MSQRMIGIKEWITFVASIAAVLASASLWLFSAGASSGISKAKVDQMIISLDEIKGDFRKLADEFKSTVKENTKDIFSLQSLVSLNNQRISELKEEMIEIKQRKPNGS